MAGKPYDMWRLIKPTGEVITHTESMVAAIDHFKASYGPVEVHAYGRCHQNEYTVFDGKGQEVGGIQPPGKYR